MYKRKINQKAKVNQVLAAFDAGDEFLPNYEELQRLVSTAVKSGVNSKEGRLTSDLGRVVMDAVLISLKTQYGLYCEFINSHGNPIRFDSPSDSIRREIQDWLTSKKKAAQN